MDDDFDIQKYWACILLRVEKKLLKDMINVQDESVGRNTKGEGRCGNGNSCICVRACRLRGRGGGGWCRRERTQACTWLLIGNVPV